MTESSTDRLSWALALAETHDAAGISESHGLICGLIAADPAISTETLIARWASLHPDTDGLETSSSEKKPDIQTHLESALEMTRTELQSTEMGFEILVPAIEQTLVQRTEGLAHWCTGFLAGFGASGGTIRDGEAQEALSMLGEIARASCQSDEDDEEGEEAAFFELVEFVKVSVLLLHEERRLLTQSKTASGDSSDPEANKSR